MSEVSLALDIGKPVVILNNTGGVSEVLARLKLILDGKTYEVAETPRQAIEMALKLASLRRETT